MGNWFQSPNSLNLGLQEVVFTHFVVGEMAESTQLYFSILPNDKIFIIYAYSTHRGLNSYVELSLYFCAHGRVFIVYQDFLVTDWKGVTISSGGCILKCWDQKLPRISCCV